MRRFVVAVALINAVMFVAIVSHDLRSLALSGLYPSPGPHLTRPQGVKSDDPVLAAARLLVAEIHDNGREAFAFCALCHSLGDEINRYGPNLHCLAARRAAGRETYRYSQAMVAHAERIGYWTVPELINYVAQPSTAVEGTRMPFPGISPGDDPDVEAETETTGQRLIERIIEHLHWSCDEPEPGLNSLRLVLIAGGECTDQPFHRWSGWKRRFSRKDAVELLREENYVLLPGPAPSGDHCAR